MESGEANELQGALTLEPEGGRGWLLPRVAVRPLVIMAVGILVALLVRTPGLVIFFAGYVWLAFTALDVSLAAFVLVASIPLGLTLHGHSVNYSDLMAIVMALGLLWKHRNVGLKQVAARVFPRAWAAPLVALLFFAVVSLVHAQSRLGATVKILELVEFFVVIVAVAADMGLAHKSWRLVMLALFVSGAAMAVYGIVQFLWALGPPSFQVYTDHVRASGTYGQPNVFGAFMEQLLPLGIAILILGPKAPRARPWLLGTIVLLALGVWVSFSRGAWVADVAAIGLMGLFVYANRRSVVAPYIGWGIAMPVVMFGVATLLGKIHIAPNIHFLQSKHYSVGGRLASITNGINSYDNQQRLLIWRSALTAIRQHLLTGVGMGEFHNWIATRMPKGLVGVPPQASNLYLEIGADTGVFGIVAIVWLQYRWFAQTVKAIWGRFGSLDPWFYALAVGSLGIFTAFSVHNLVDYMIDHGVIVPLLLAMGVIAAIVREGTTRSAAAAAPSTPKGVEGA
ncbi:MAG: O-antigen ligase family protein [Thermaerobacter sp.]|nr:O-antigen ligase family protein [Thermaerobacter sp.]